jgi:hypothetical protein
MFEQIYGIREGYQAKMRCSGDGPEYIKLGSKVYYEEVSIERWLATKRRTSTSDTGQSELHHQVEPGGRRQRDNIQSAQPRTR